MWARTGGSARKTTGRGGRSMAAAVADAETKSNEPAPVVRRPRDLSSGPRVVKMEGIALLNIIKHAADVPPDMAAGSLLGMAVQDTVEVTYAFPYPTEDTAQYERNMMVALREVNVDNNCVGWYQSVYMGSYCTPDVVDNQFKFQDSPEIGGNAIMIAFDSVRSTQGVLAIKALRLTKQFMDDYRSGKFTLDSLSELTLTNTDVFEELKIEITTSPLQRALLVDLLPKDEEDVDLTRLDLSTNPFLNSASNYERRVGEQRRRLKEALEKRRAENEVRVKEGLDPLPEQDIYDSHRVPDSVLHEKNKHDKLETLLVSARINSYCQEISRFAGQSFGKLFLAESLQESTV